MSLTSPTNPTNPTNQTTPTNPTNPIPHLPVCEAEHQMAHGFFVEPGGMGNFLIMARRLALRVAALGSLGDDDYGRRVRALLEAEGVDMSAVASLNQQPTTLCFVLVDDAGRHVFLGVRSQTVELTLSEDWQARIRHARALYFNGYSLLSTASAYRVTTAVAYCTSAGVPVFFDPGPSIPKIEPALMESCLRRSTAVLLTSAEARQLLGAGAPDAAARSLLSRGAQMAVVKWGADGCYLATASEAVHVPAFAVPVRDTTGAGDAFDAAIVAGYLNRHSLEQMGRLANAVGAATVTKLGTGTRLPQRHEIEALLARPR